MAYADLMSREVGGVPIGSAAGLVGTGTTTGGFSPPTEPVGPTPLEETEAGLQEIIDLVQPELEARGRALGAYEDILTGVTDITQRPGYEEGLETGRRAIETSAAARGMTLSSANLENLAAFGTQYHQQQRQQALQEIAGLAGITQPGQQAALGAMGEMASLPMLQQQMELAASQGAAATGAANIQGIGSLLTGIALLSDLRTKQNIEHIGTENGINIYIFEYRPEFQPDNGYGKHVGVIAQEVFKTHPEAVILGDDGYMRVNYTALFGE